MNIKELREITNEMEDLNQAIKAFKVKLQELGKKS